MEPAINTEALQELKNLMGDSLNDILQTFLDYMPSQIRDLRTAIQEENAEMVFNLAHKMKSSSSSIGAMGLARKAEQIELIGRAGKTDGTRDAYEELHRLYLDVEAVLKQELGVS
jgi:HPt (histidine-containing phosphotransfer) domain-containing protein